MTTTSGDTQTNLSKFQGLLRELFQFDCADLDFGIYRIMNHKREAIEQFVNEQLPATVAKTLDKGPLAQQAQAAAKLGEVGLRVRETLGEYAIDERGGLVEAHRELPIGKEYLEAQQQDAGGARSRDAVEAAIYNHLNTFFSRYYEDGDFISKRRYGRNQRYAIPYNGEEGYLHWANSDQYYVKTDEHFRNYDWKAPNGVSVHFRLTNANVEQNNVKGDRRFFVPRASETTWDAASQAVTIPFEYRPLSASEAAKYGRPNTQDKIIAEATAAIPSQLNGSAKAITALTGEHHHNGKDAVTRLQHHLGQYVRRNNSDFFIHKGLAGFLHRELDFYLKNEVLNLDSMDAAGQDMSEGWFQQMRLTKTVGGKIIEFLSQIEDFQKMLWEKRKFVTDTQYCITLGSISPDFYPDIKANDTQWHEWRDLFDVDGSDRSDGFLQSHPTLVLDTKHFHAGFTDRLLASFSDLEGMTDGLLVHGENWQALNFLSEAYTSVVKAIYIDPPYNAPSSEVIYKNGYKHSTFLSLIHDRVYLSKQLAEDEIVHVMAIDEHEHERCFMLLKSIFSDMEHKTVTVLNNPSGQQGQNFSDAHDYACFAYKVNQGRQIGEEVREDADLRNFRDVTGEESKREAAKNCFYPIFLKDSAIVGFGPVCDEDFHPTSINTLQDDGRIAVYPVDPKGVERKWRFARHNVERIKGELIPHFIKSRKVWDIKRSKNTFNFKTVWTDAKYSANNHGTQLLNSILGSELFDYPKSIYTVTDCVRAALNGHSSSTVLDYFAGSGTTGHAVINLNREDGGQRNFILVEMGEYFDTVLLPRIKKVTYTPEWKDGKPARPATAEEADRSPRIVKYIRLESYEDALDSIRFDPAAEQQPLAESSDEYLIKYMLHWETKDSETLLNPAKLVSPFSYQLQVHVRGEKQERTVDLPETFNYLIGLVVQKRAVYDDDGRRYLVFCGEARSAPGRPVAVIWRETKGWTEDDFARDRDFVAQQYVAGDAETVYVNGDSCIPGAKPIEPMFKARMFAGVQP